MYHGLGFPTECRFWSCQWLVEETAVGLRRPDRSGYVIDNMPDLFRIRDDRTGRIEEVPAIQIWCDPARPDAWRDPALLAFIEARSIELGTAALVRFGSREAIGIIPPVLSADKKWHYSERSATDAPSATGSLLLDRLRELVA